MTTNYIVYTQIHNGTPDPDRYYYGTYDHQTANEVALELGGGYPTYHCVCRADEARELGIQYLPEGL